MVRLIKDSTSFDDFISTLKPTAQVRALGLDLLKDNKPHSRQEIIEYIKKCGEKYRLPSFSSGCIAGGIQSILDMPECQKLGAGIYKLNEDNALQLNIPLIDQAVRICETAVSDIRSIARKIDYITASVEEEKTLETLKECVNRLEEIIKFLDNTEESL